MFSYTCRVASKTVGPATVAFAGFGVCSVSETTASKTCSRLSTSTTSYAVRKLEQAWLPSTHLQRRSVRTATSSSSTTINTAGKAAKRSPSFTLSSKKFSTTASSSSSASLMEWYEGHLHARPVITKMLTGTVLWSLGDAVAQIVPVVSGQSDKPLEYDWPRTGRAALFGFALHAPTSHVHFNFLEWITHRLGVTGYAIPVFKAFMEQFVYWSWVSNSMYHAAMGAMQGMNTQQIVQRIKDVLWDTQKAQWVFWIPVQLLNFQFVPVRHQLNVVLLTSIVWTALLSAWYPPVDVSETEGNKTESLDAQKALQAVKPE